MSQQQGEPKLHPGYTATLLFLFLGVLFLFFGEDLVIKNNNKGKPHHTQEGGVFFTHGNFKIMSFQKLQNVEGRGLPPVGRPRAVQLLLGKADSLWASFQQKIL